jgi:hypothetical protein
MWAAAVAPAARVAMVARFRAMAASAVSGAMQPTVVLALRALARWWLVPMAAPVAMVVPVAPAVSPQARAPMATAATAATQVPAAPAERAIPARLARAKPVRPAAMVVREASAGLVAWVPSLAPRG